MNPVLLFDDWRLTVLEGGAQRYCEPAAALEADGQVQFGTAALAQARLSPRQSNLDYLGRLSADPLNQPFRSARNHADLLYQNLKALLELAPSLAQPSLVVVPTTASSEQLSLLLGVAQEAGLSIGGFTDFASACAAAEPPDSETQLLEINLGAAYLCPIRIEVTTEVGAATEFPDLGIQRIVDGWTNVIADQFVSSSRFDPLHAAQTEQQLYNLVYAWFGAQTPSSYLTIEHNGETRRQEVSLDALRRRLSTTLEPLLEQLDPQRPVRLGPNAIGVPLLGDLLAERYQLERTAPEHIWLYLTDNAEALTAEDEIRYHRHLKPARAVSSSASAERAVSPDVSEPKAATGRPSHGLHATTAYRIGSPTLPRQAIGDAALGSTINHEGRLFTLIEVRD